MPVSDISTYALKIAFELQDQATPNLNLVDQHLVRIEQNIAQISTSAMTSLQNVTNQLNNSLMQISQQYDKIATSSLANVKPLQDASAMNTNIQKDVSKEATTLRDDILGAFTEIIETLKKKEGLLTTESKLIENEQQIASKVGKEFDTWGNNIDRSYTKMRRFHRGLLDVRGAVTETVTASEMFVNANFRLYGSQSQLVGNANKLALAYGIMRKEAREAIAILGNLRVPNDMIEKLTETTVKFNRLSGVSIGVTGQWQKNLVAMGLSAAEIERKLTHVAVAMRRFGLDTQDVTSIMQTQQEQAQNLRLIFGDKTAAEIQRAQVAIAAFAKELGATPEVSRRAAAALGTIEPWRLQQLGAMTGIAADKMRTAEGQTQAIARASATLAQQLRNTTDQNVRAALVDAARGQYGEQLGNAIAELAQQQAGLNSKVKDGVAAQELMNRALNGHIDQVDNLTNIYEESNQTIAAQLGLLKNAFFASIGAIWSKLEPAIIVFLQWLNSLIYGIGKVVTTIGNWLDALGPVGSSIKNIIAIVMAVVAAFVLFHAVLNIFGLVSKLATSIARGLGTIIHGVMAGMARGLTALSAHKATMLTLAVLLVAMGVGALLFAMGVAKIAEQGAAGIKALLGLASAIVFVAVSLVVAASMTGAAMPVLLALAVVLVAAGFAAFLLAYSVKMLADVGAGSIGILLSLSVALLVLGLGLIGLAILATPVLPALFAVAIVLLIVAVAALLIAAALYIAIDALKQLNISLAMNILGFAIVLSIAGPVLIIAAILLGIGAGILAVSGIILAIAGALVFVGALLVFIGAIFLFMGAGLIIISSAMLAVGAALLIIGSILLIAATPMLLLAGVALIPAAIVLYIAGLVLLPAALLIGIAGILLLIGGVGVYVGGLLLSMGAPLLYNSAWPLLKAGGVLLLAAPVLLLAAAAMAAIGILILIAGVGIFIGGLLMFAGAFLLITGATMLLIAGVFLALAAVAIVLAAPLLIAGSFALIIVAVFLAYAGAAMIVPAILMAVIGILLFIGGLGILLGGMMIKAGAWFLIGGSLMLAESAPSLMDSSVVLFFASGALLIASTLLWAASIPFMLGALGLLIGGALFFVAAFLIAAGAVFFEVAAGVLVAFAGPFLDAAFNLMLAGIYIIIASVLLYLGGVMMLPAAAILYVAGWVLWAAVGPIMDAANLLQGTGAQLFAIGMGFWIGGFGMLYGGYLMIAAASVLNAAGDALGSIAGSLGTNVQPLVGISNQIAHLGMMVAYGALMLYFGASRLSSAASLLVWPSVIIASSLMIIAMAADRFASAMLNLHDAMAVPLGTLLTTFSVESRAAAITLFETLDVILSRIEAYSDSMEANANNIAAAFRGILPTMPFGLFGLNITQAQSFRTAPDRVRPNDFIENRQRHEDRQIQNKIKEKLDEISERLLHLDETIKAVTVAGGGGAGIKDAVSDIAELLRDNLPNMVREQSSGLANSLNEWTK